MAKKRRSESYYFDTKEEIAVRNFLNTDSQREKDKIFKEVLYEPILKMVESQIKRYKLMRADMTLEEQIIETTSFVAEKFYKFKPEKNKKAYSYYGTIAVNYLKAQLIKYSKIKNRDISYEDISSELEEDGVLGFYEIDVEEDEKLEVYDFIPILIKSIEEELINNKKLKTNDIKVGNAIISLLNNWESIIDNDEKSNILNRNKILYYIREATFLNPKDLRNSMKKFKSIYFLIKKDIMGEAG